MVEYSSHYRVVVGSIPADYTLGYEFYGLVSNVFALITRSSGFDSHPKVLGMSAYNLTLSIGCSKENTREKILF